MQHPASDESLDILCPCSGTTRAQIRRHFEKGTADLDGISRATGACSGCGGCEYDVQTWLDELAASQIECGTLESTSQDSQTLPSSPTIHLVENSP